MKFAYLLAQASLAGFPVTAHTHCGHVSDVPSQVKLIDEQYAGPALGSLVATDGFPALSETGEELAILKSLDAHQQSAILEITALSSGRQLKKFVLLPDSGSAATNERRERMKQEIAEPNTYLSDREFKPLDVLFSVKSPPSGSFPRPLTWEQEHLGFRIVYDYSTLSLTITSATTGERLLFVERPTRKIGPLSDPEDYCYVKGSPEKGWIDKEGKLVVIYLSNLSSRDACDQAEEWIIERLAKRPGAQ